MGGPNQGTTVIYRLLDFSTLGGFGGEGDDPGRFTVEVNGCVDLGMGCGVAIQGGAEGGV